MTITKIESKEHYGDRPLSKVRVFFHEVGYTVKKDLIEGGRWNRPHKIFRKHLPEIVNKFPSLLGSWKASWSQKAGCPCGCSPGFILDIHPAKAGFEVVFVNYKP